MNNIFFVWLSVVTAETTGMEVGRFGSILTPNQKPAWQACLSIFQQRLIHRVDWDGQSRRFGRRNTEYREMSRARRNELHREESLVGRDHAQSVWARTCRFRGRGWRKCARVAMDRL